MTDEFSKKSKVTKATKSHKRKKRRIKKDPLEFVESPVDGDIHCETTINPGSPREVPSVKIGYETSSSWVSPEAYNCVSKYPLRSAMHSKNTSKRPRLIRRIHKENSEPISQSISNSRQNANLNSNNCSSFSIISENHIPIPNCIATPDSKLCLNNSVDLHTPKSFSKETVHFIFNGKTPILREFSILVKNTPL